MKIRHNEIDEIRVPLEIQVSDNWHWLLRSSAQDRSGFLFRFLTQCYCYSIVLENTDEKKNDYVRNLIQLEYFACKENPSKKNLTS